MSVDAMLRQIEHAKTGYIEWAAKPMQYQYISTPRKWESRWLLKNSLEKIVTQNEVTLIEEEVE